MCRRGNDNCRNKHCNQGCVSQKGSADKAACLHVLHASFLSSVVFENSIDVELLTESKTFGVLDSFL